jgi:hypothetical protein
MQTLGMDSGFVHKRIRSEHRMPAGDYSPDTGSADFKTTGKMSETAQRVCASS